MSAQTVTTADTTAAFDALGRLQGMANSPRADQFADTIAAALSVARAVVAGREEATKTRQRRRAIDRRLAAEERAWREAMVRRYDDEEYGDALLSDQLMTVLYGSEYGAEA
jgi:hypothetical protein